MRYLTYLFIAVLSLLISGCGTSTDVPSSRVEKYLKYYLRDQGPLDLKCIGGNPTFKLTDEADPTRDTSWQQKVVPDQALLSFIVVLESEVEPRKIAGTLEVQARHSRYELFYRGDYINFLILMKEWHFAAPDENLDQFCD